MQIFKTPHPLTTDIDISSEEFWHSSFLERDESFEWLRKNAPVSWHPPLETPRVSAEVHGETGFWAVVLADDIQFVSQHHELFSSALGGIVLVPVHPDYRQTPTFLGFDPPAHTRYRKIMSAAFTPKAVRRLDDKIKERARSIVENVVGAGEIEFVDAVASRLPMMTVADMVGVPESLVQTFARAGDLAVSAADEGVVPEGISINEFVQAQIKILQDIGVDLVQFRRKNPGDDIATALAHFEVDGCHLNEAEIGSVMHLLSVAGNDTTKQTTTASIYALDRNPEQRRWLTEEFDHRINSSIEEFIRHASPVMQFARTATQDIELGGQHITAGDKVCIFYCSGNRDENRFENPREFDLTRSPNLHVGFGGGGVHYCLGNGIAKVQMRSLFREITTLLPKLEVVAEPQYLYSSFINGIRRLRVRTN